MTSKHNLIDTRSSYVLSSLETDNLLTNYFQVENFGFLKLTSNEQYPQTWYPTPDDVVRAGWFTLDIHNSKSGDFNNDGLKDLVLQPMLFPHIVPHETPIYPIFLFQNALGGFDNPKEILERSKFPDKHFLYRIETGDFDGNEITDVVFSSMGMWDHNTGQSISQSPLVVYGGKDTKLSWTDYFENLPLSKGAPNWQIGYQYGHSLAVGDFNGDGYSDWFSQWYVSYGNTQNKFDSELILPNPLAAQELPPWDNQWVWPLVNAAVSSDFNGDGYDDLIVSNMPNLNPLNNGGDLWLLLGSPTGLQGGINAISLNRKNDIPGNVGTNFMVSEDFNGDGHADLLFLEHYWTTDSGDSTHYYSKGKLKLLLGDGKGNFEDQSQLITDPLGGHRHGEGTLHAMDVNGDGWIDLVLSGYGFTEGDIWGGSQETLTSIFLNNRGRLEYIDSEVFAYVSSFQFSGEEETKPFITDTVPKLFPIDIGSDGMIDFVGFVSTPLHSWPQIEQQYLYAYVVKSVAPLGRVLGNELLIGTKGDDKIWGYDGNDTIVGKGGNDTIDGGTGVDISVYHGSYDEYSVIFKSTEVVVQDSLPSRDGSDILVNIERLQFADINLALDTDGVAGQAYRIYQAAFDRVPDATGLGYWINVMDNGAALAGVAGGFIGSDEFQSRYGDASDVGFIKLLYENVLDRQPDAAGYAFWQEAMGRGLTREGLLVEFSESRENKANVEGLIANGIEYTPFIS